MMSTATKVLIFNRRQFLRITGSASAAIALAACAPATAPTTSTDTLTTAAPDTTAGEPQRGGTLRVAFGEAPANLDPHMTFVMQGGILRSHVYDTLVWNDENLAPQPALATSWEAADDQLSWTFQLREGVTFHHGTPFTALDVVHNFERILGEDFGSPAQTAFSFVNGAEAVDDYTVKITLGSPNVDFPLLLGDPINTFFIAPHDRTWEELAVQPSGTGPFQLTEYLPGESATLTRNDSYWQEGSPYLDGLQFLYMPEAATQVAALTSGTIDLIWQLTTDSVDALAGASGVVVEEVPGGGYQPIVMRLDQEPFTDVRVRQAFKYATNREGMVGVVLRGRGVLGNDQPLPPGHPFAADLSPYPYDPEKAKALLAEAGYPDGLDVTLYTADLRPGMVASAVAFQEMAKESGINVQIEQVPGSSYWSEHWMQSALTVSNWGLFPSADTILSLAYYSTGVWNESGLQNAELDGLIEAGRAETDPAKRQEIYTQIQQIIQEEGGTIVPYFSPQFYARRSNVHGARYVPQGLGYWHEAWLVSE